MLFLNITFFLKKFKVWNNYYVILILLHKMQANSIQPSSILKEIHT